MSTGDFVFDLPKNRSNAIKVIGVGGGGSNAVNYMFEQGITGVDFVICNTDAQALQNSSVPNRIQLGQAVTEGLGAGANPEVGEQAAIESLEEIKSALETTTKMVFITAGMGGGTGTGAAPVIAGVAKEMGILTVGIVTAPFYFEGKMRLEQAERGIEKLRKNVDSLIVINNDKLRELYGNLGYKSGFAKADEVLTTAAKGIAEVITHHYSTNIDMRDAKTVLADSGTAIMGSGRASGQNKAHDAISSALDSPLLNNNKISGAKNVLLLILSGESEITIDEIGIINDYIQEEAGHNANIIMGMGDDPTLGDEISVTIVATGFPMEDQVYTGRDEQKIFHRLEEEQPITKSLEIQPVPVKNTPDFDEPFLKQEEFVNNTTEVNESEVRYVLDLNEPISSAEDITPDFEPRLKTPTETPIEPKADVFSNPTPTSPLDGPAPTSTPQNSFGGDLFGEVKNEMANTYFEEEKANTVIFSIDEQPQSSYATPQYSAPQQQEELNTSVANQVEQVVKPIDDSLNQPISSTLNSSIEERRARLKQFNFKFKNALQSNSLDQVESIPAYQRQGIELNERQENKPSDFVYSQNANNELKIRPNNFLHDNVD